MTRGRKGGLIEGILKAKKTLVMEDITKIEFLCIGNCS